MQKMANLIDWDNIYLHMHDNDDRYKRRLRRKQLYIDCSPNINIVSSTDGSSKKPKTVKDQIFLGYDEHINFIDAKPIRQFRPTFGTKRNVVDPDVKMFKEGLTEGGRCLVLEVDKDASSDDSLKKLETVQDQFFLHNDELMVACPNNVTDREPIRDKNGTKKNAVDLDLKIFKEDLREKGLLLASSDVSLEKLKNVQYQDLRNDEFRVDDCCDVSHVNFSRVKIGTKRMVVDPEYEMFLEKVKEDGHAFGLKVDRNDGSFDFLKYEKDVVRKECRRKLKGDNGENSLGKQKGDTAESLRNNKKKEKGEKVVLRGDVDFVSTEEKRNVMLHREGVCGKIYKPSKIIKNERPLNLDDRRDMDNLRKLKRIKYKEVERSPCLTRKRHGAVLSRVSAKCQRTRPRNERKDPVVQQDKDIENSKFISGIGKLDAMVKVENFDGSTNVVLVKKRRQVIQGRDIAYNPNLRERSKREKKLGKYAKVKEENANSLNHNEEDNEHSSDLEILDMDNQQNLSIFEVAKVFNASVIEDKPFSMESPGDYKTSEFREKLVDILKRPYNQEEYKSLMQKAKYRHLKGGPEYSDGLKEKKVSETYGKSLLDYHPDVRRRLRQSRNLCKRLNILRGFIYWSEKTCQDGAFQPWLDKSCSTVTPSPH